METASQSSAKDTPGDISPAPRMPSAILPTSPPPVESLSLPTVPLPSTWEQSGGLTRSIIPFSISGTPDL